MDLITVFSYLNKISLVAFILTAGFLGYQFYLLKKESKNNPKKQPPIPDFNKNENAEALNYTQLPSALANPQPVAMKKDFNILPFVAGAGLLVLTLGVFIILNSRKEPEVATKTIQPTKPVVPSPTSLPAVSPTLITAENISITPDAEASPEVTPSTTITPTNKITATPTPDEEVSTSPTPETELTGTPTPTEVILAVISPTSAVTGSTANLTTTISPTQVTSLPLTGLIDKGLLFFGVAAVLIFFAFIF